MYLIKVDIIPENYDRFLRYFDSKSQSVSDQRDIEKLSQSSQSAC